MTINLRYRIYIAGYSNVNMASYSQNSGDNNSLDDNRFNSMNNDSTTQLVTIQFNIFTKLSAFDVERNDQNCLHHTKQKLWFPVVSFLSSLSYNSTRCIKVVTLQYNIPLLFDDGNWRNIAKYSKYRIIRSRSEKDIHDDHHFIENSNRSLTFDLRKYCFKFNDSIKWKFLRDNSEFSQWSPQQEAAFENTERSTFNSCACSTENDIKYSANLEGRLSTKLKKISTKLSADYECIVSKYIKRKGTVDQFKGAFSTIKLLVKIILFALGLFCTVSKREALVAKINYNYCNNRSDISQADLLTIGSIRNMEEKKLRKSRVEIFRSVESSKGNISSSASDEHLASVNIKFNDVDTKLLRPHSLTQTNQVQVIGDELQSVENHYDDYRSPTFVLPPIQYPLLQTSSTVKKCLTSFNRGRSHSPRKVHKYCDNFEESISGGECSSPTTVPESAVATSTLMNSRANSKACLKESRPNDDKENESPKITDLMSSPKMKICEQILFEQNSPKHLDSNKSRFSFPPKQIYSEDVLSNVSSLPLINAVSEQINSCDTCTIATNSASPLLSSAVYKHGNYFKFPEVDYITSDILPNTSKTFASSDITSERAKAAIVTDSMVTETASSSAILRNTFGSQPSRRVRLKSISLDSDGARLVEDNLGIPVEELIQYSNKTTSDRNGSSNSTMYQSQLNNIEKSGENTNLFDTPEASLNDAFVETQDVPISIPKVTPPTLSQSCRKNRNNLKINVESNDSCFRSSYENGIPAVKVPTPKTPTLTQTKQKAVSLDSSDANNIVCYCTGPSPIRSQHHLHQQQSLNSRSAHHLSSISVPTTPKRNVNPNKKKIGNKVAFYKSVGPPKMLSHHQSTINPVLMGFDAKMHQCNSIPDEEHSMRIAIDIDDNYGECATELDDDHFENFYLGEIEDEVVVLAEGNKLPYIDENEIKRRIKSGGEASESEAPNKSYDYLLLGSNLQSQKFGMLSLSNNNLETLPEVMTITDFDNSTQVELPKLQNSTQLHQQERNSQQNDEMKRNNLTKPHPSARSNILQRRGSNQSLTINLNGSLGNLTKYMSASNYSLGSYTGSNYNLNNCPQHHLSMYCQIPSNTSSTQSVMTHGYCNSQMNILHPNSSSPVQQQSGFETDLSSTDGCPNKKNLLQRRGSNTSLTLNIKTSNQANLSRFSSHSSLNISSNLAKYKQSTQSIYGHHQSQPQCHQYYQSQSHRQQSMGKKGLLERRNSNASLTLNIHNNGLSNSSHNLRSSACSLSNITNMSIECYETNTERSNSNNILDETNNQIRSSILPSAPRQQRKFLSSENLNTMISQCNKLNQTHIRNSTKTCFGSVSDLKPNIINGNENITKDNIERGSEVGVRQFEQSDLCSCTGVRNITTKPLSPQSTSEDFKMYLANIQLLQNATNVLTEEHLRKLHFIFKENYEMSKRKNSKDEAMLGLLSDHIDRGHETKTQTQYKHQICSKLTQFHITLPNDNEKKQLLRSLHEEFWDLPTNHQEKPLVFGSQSKNRYKTILPNEHSRVLLESELGSLHEPYINANFIKVSVSNHSVDIYL